jgi:hypothetical protein
LPGLETLPAASHEVAFGAFRRRAPSVTFVERLTDYIPNRRNGKEVMTRAKRGGVRYERCVHAFLRNFAFYERNPWLRYIDRRGKSHICQPDGLFLREELVVIVEVKTNHCLDAYAQLTDLYLPVVRYAYPEHPIVRLEICSTFTPTIKWPEPIALLRRIDDVFELRGGCAALQWRRGDY